MFYPTGKTTDNRCLICMEDESPAIEECLSECEANKMVEALKNWLDENQYCVECWQMKECLMKRGLTSEKLDEDMGAGGAPVAPAGAPAGSAFATLNTTAGMGMAAPPTNGGTNAGFYDSSKDGSGDKFPSLTAGTPAAQNKKKRKVINYKSFLKTFMK